MIEKRKVPPARILRSLMVVTGTGTRLFSDKLKNGHRSFKIWGWQGKQYFEAAKIMRHHGYSTVLLQTGPGRRTMRLWVK